MIFFFLKQGQQYIAGGQTIYCNYLPKFYTQYLLPLPKLYILVHPYYLVESSNNTYNLDNDFRCLSLLVSMAVISFTSRYNSEVSRGIPTKKRIVFLCVYVDASFNNYNKHVVPLCSKMGKNVHDYLNLVSKN